MQWFYVANGRQCGPVTEAELAELARSGVLKPSDYVWNESMGETWAHAGTVAGLFVSPGPPPLNLAPPMDADQVPGPIGYGEPARRAWNRMYALLFRPLSLGKWFALGFSAWLATLSGQGGGGSVNLGSGEWQEKLREQAGDPAVMFEAMREFMHQNGLLLMSLLSIAIVISIVLGLVFLWIRCRGKFMFLDNLIHDRTEIAAPWRMFRSQANSLFLWNVVYGLICLAIGGVLLAAAVISFILPLFQGGGVAAFMMPIALNLSAWIVLLIVAAYIGRYLEDFVVPLMYNDNLSAVQAWSRFLALFGEHRGAFIVYGLYYLMLSLLAGACVVILILGTCCLAGCLMIFPYIGTVVLLPMLVFFRHFSLEYLAQFGPEFRMRQGSSSEG